MPLLSFLLAARVAAAATTAAPVAFERALASAGLSYRGSRKFSVDDDRSFGRWNADPQAARRLSAHEGRVRLRVAADSGLSGEQARDKIKERLGGLRLLYEGDSAYPGMAARRPAVPAGLRLRELPRERCPDGCWEAPATERLTYGVVVEDAAAYRALMFFLYCPRSRAWAQIELFFPKEAFDEGAAAKERPDFRCAP